MDESEQYIVKTSRLTENASDARSGPPVPSERKTPVPAPRRRTLTDGIPCWLEISGIPAYLDNNTFRTVLENALQGGGEVEALQRKDGQSTALVRYKDLQVARKLLDGGCMKYKSVSMGVALALADAVQRATATTQPPRKPSFKNLAGVISEAPAVTETETATREKAVESVGDRPKQEQFVSMDEGVAELLDRHARKEVHAILTGLSEHGIELHFIYSKQDKPGCRIRGHAAGLPLASKQLSDLAERVELRSHAVEPHMTRYMLMDDTRVIANAICSRRFVVVRYPDERAAQDASIETVAGVDRVDAAMKGSKIDVVAKHGFLKRANTDVNRASPNVKDEDSGSDDIAQRATPYTHTHVVMKSTGCVIKLLVGDITRHPVDVIVCVNTEKLSHAGSAASALLKAGGNEIQTECIQYVREHGPLPLSKAFTSTAGKLPCRALVHIVAPVWHGGIHDEEKNLELAVQTALVEASKSTLHKTVSVPFIGSGISKFPKNKAARIILNEVGGYLSVASTTVTEVDIICWSEDDAAWFATELVNIVHENKLKQLLSTKHEVEENEAATEREAVNGGGMPMSDYEEEVYLNEEEDADWSAGSTPCVITTREGVSVTLLLGSVAAERVDVILCTSGADLNLSAGAVSRSLLAAAGPELQAELSARYPQGLTRGQVGMTGGHGLDCIRVHHATLLHLEAGWTTSYEQVLHSILRESLKLASYEKMRSLAWPTIGCGNLKYPAEVVATAMFDEIRLFSAANKSTSLRDVRIVVYLCDQATIEIFAKVFFALLSPERIEAVRDRAHPPSASRKKSVSDPVAVLRIGEITFEVKCGDVTKENCDVIVNDANDDRLGLSRGIMSEYECAPLGELTNNGIAVTEAPAASSPSTKHVFHVCAQTASEWKTVLLNCLKEADRRSLATLALPPLELELHLVIRSGIRPSTGRGPDDESSETTGIANDACELHWVIRCDSAHSSFTDLVVLVFGALRRFVNSSPASVRRVTVLTLSQPALAEFTSFIENKDKGPGLSFRFKKLNNKIRSTNHQSLDLTSFSDVDDSYTAWDPGASPTIPLVLSLYALSPADMDAALGDVAKRTKRLVIKSSSAGSLQRLIPAHKQMIQSLEGRLGTQISIDPFAEEIRLTGAADAVASVVDEVEYILHEQDRRLLNKLETLGQRVQWEYIGVDGTFINFDSLSSATIEAAFQEQMSSIYLKAGETMYRIKLRDMTREIVGSPGTRSRINRREIAIDVTELPRSWVRMDEKSSFIPVLLASDDDEYKTVIKRWAQPTLTVVKVERIQNPVLYHQYAHRKQLMDAANGTTPSNERRLWHGTRGDSVVNINGGGFNRSYCGKNDVVYGDGVYFATSSNYSINNDKGRYCPKDDHGLRYIYQARVLTGRFTQGARGLKEPPALPDRTDARYNSIVNKVANPALYVVFYDTQAYPEYLITFQ